MFILTLMLEANLMQSQESISLLAMGMSRLVIASRMNKVRELSREGCDL